MSPKREVRDSLEWLCNRALHLLQDVHALFELRAFQLQRLQAVLQRRHGQPVRVLLLPLPIAVPLVRAPAQQPNVSTCW